ncbi:hypothetical protein D3C85_1815330 [compost metagenome]
MMLGVALRVLVEVALARKVMVDADDARRPVSVKKECEISLTYPILKEYRPPGMVAIHHAAQEIKA